MEMKKRISLELRNRNPAEEGSDAYTCADEDTATNTVPEERSPFPDTSSTDSLSSFSPLSTGSSEDYENVPPFPMSCSSPPCYSAPCVKRMRMQNDTETLQRLLIQLREDRLEQQRQMDQEDDELSRFGRTVADMLRRLPREQQPQAMFEVHRVLYAKHLQNM